MFGAMCTIEATVPSSAPAFDYVESWIVLPPESNHNGIRDNAMKIVFMKHFRAIKLHMPYGYAREWALLDLTLETAVRFAKAATAQHNRSYISCKEMKWKNRYSLS